MGKILILAFLTTLALTALAQPEEYLKFPPIEDSKVFIFDNRHIHKLPDGNVLVKVDSGTDYDKPHPEKVLETKYEPIVPKREYSEGGKNYQYQVREVIEQDTKLEREEPVYLQFYDPQKLNKKGDSKNIDVDINISEEKKKRYHQGVLTYIPRIPKIFGNYDDSKPKNVLVNVNIHKDDLDKYTKQDGAKKININVKIRKVDEPEKEIDAQEKRDGVIDKIYRVSKKYTGL